MSRPRVVHVITGLGAGGAEHALLRLLAAQRSRYGAADPAVVSLGGRDALAAAIEAQGVEVHALGLSPGRPNLAAPARLARLLTRLDADLICGWMYHGNAMASLSARGRPVIWNVRHALDDPGSERWSTALLVRFLPRLGTPVRIVYNSRHAAAQHERLGYPADRTEIVPNGFDLTEFQPDPAARAQVRAELGLGPGAILFGLIARLHPVKDHRTFLAAASRLAARADVCFVLAGSGVHAASLDVPPGLDRRVFALGERADIPRLTAALDVATCCSRSEAFPNAVGEAMACEVPCVVTDVGDCRELVGESGVVVPVGEPEALAAAWERMLEAGAGGRQEKGRLARLRIAERYSIDAVARHYDGLYRDWTPVGGGIKFRAGV